MPQNTKYNFIVKDYIWGTELRSFYIWLVSYIKLNIIFFGDYKYFIVYKKNIKVWIITCTINILILIFFYSLLFYKLTQRYKNKKKQYNIVNELFMKSIFSTYK